MKPELVRKAESLGIPLTQKTERGEAKLGSIEINGLGVSVGYMLPSQKKLKRIKNELFYYNKNGERIPGANPNMTGDVSGLWGDCSGLWGLWGDCSGLSGDVSGLTGDVSGLTGCCTGLTGCCTGLTGVCSYNIDE